MTAQHRSGFFPLAGVANDGYSTSDHASATCLCGAVQLDFPISGEGFVDDGSFVCNCYDCHKISASIFASNFTILETHLKHNRGKENLTRYGQDITIGSGGTMTNYFCKTCGSLLYRIGSKFPNLVFMRIGSVDDFSLHDTVLRPRVEQFISERTSWFSGVEGVRKAEKMGY